MKFTIKEFYNMDDDTFCKFYEGKEFREILEFLEIRTRMELLSIIRGFKRKGDVLFEIRIKSPLSAFEKLRKELAKRQGEFGDQPVYLFEIIQDLVGARVICIQEEAQKQVFQDILRAESLSIQSSGLEFYSAPFRDFTLARDIHDELIDIIKGVKATWNTATTVEKKSKASNYESLHFYVKYESKIDAHLLGKLVKEREDQKGSEKVRNRAEAEYLLGLFKSFTEQQLDEMRRFPVEFQIRTMLDHLWAQEEHKYIYKADTLAATPEENEEAEEILRSAFTGLKYAYYNVDRLRSLVRSVTSSKSTVDPSFEGRSKDNNTFRFVYFPDGASDLQSEFDRAEKLFLECEKDFSGHDTDGRPILNALNAIYEAVVSFDEGERESGAIFDNANWGRKRIFYMFLAYLALSSSKKVVTEEAARFLNKKMGLLELVGQSAFGGLINNRNGTVILASLVYDRVKEYDRLGWRNRDTDDARTMVFLDPLVGVRLASSYFLQSEYSGAAKAMRDMFAFVEKDGRVWADNELAKDLERAEVLMRYSQYVFFDDFNSKNGFQGAMTVLQAIFENIFKIPDDAFSTSLYRSYAWYYVLINYLIESHVNIPEMLMKFRNRAREYLVKHFDAAGGLMKEVKPESILVGIYLPVHLDTDTNKVALIEDAYNTYAESIQSHTSYPTSAVRHLNLMAASMKERALKKVIGVTKSTFISYSHENKPTVTRLVSLLQAQKVNVFYDADFKRGRYIDPQIEQAMLNATSAIIVVTPEYWNSSYAEEERGFLMGQHRHEEKRRKEGKDRPNGFKLIILRLGVDEGSFRKNAPLMAGILSYDVTEDQLEQTILKVAQQLNEN